MKLFLITFMVLGSEPVSPLKIEVCGKDEIDAKFNFLESKKFYNTNDPEKVIIVSIRQIGQL